MLLNILLCIQVVVMIVATIYVTMQVYYREKKQREIDELMIEEIKVRILKTQNEILDKLKEEEK